MQKGKVRNAKVKMEEGQVEEGAMLRAQRRRCSEWTGLIFRRSQRSRSSSNLKFAFFTLQFAMIFLRSRKTLPSQGSKVRETRNGGRLVTTSGGLNFDS